jgi:hypothetical protein
VAPDRHRPTIVTRADGREVGGVQDVLVGEVWLASGQAEVERFESQVRSIRPEDREHAMAEQAADPQAFLRRCSPPDPGNVGLGRGWAGLDLVVHLGACDKHDQTYFNGDQVGATGWETRDAWAKVRIYRIPGRLVHPGRNLLAVGVYSYRNAGGIYGPADKMWVAPDGVARGEAVSLVGPWRYTIEHGFGVVKAAEANPLLLPDQIFELFGVAPVNSGGQEVAGSNPVAPMLTTGSRRKSGGFLCS